MRKPLLAATAVAASAALTFGMPMAAEARTAKELKLCWNSPAGATKQFPLRLVADGPASRSANLAPGTCKAFHVPRGEYKVVFPYNNQPLIDYAQADSFNYDEICGAAPQGTEWDTARLLFTVKRGKSVTYDTQEANYPGYITTTVQKRHLTRVTVKLQCIAQELA